MQVLKNNYFETQYCKTHVNQIYTNFCSSQSCIQPLCPECVEIHYEYHKKLKTEAEVEIAQQQIESLKKIKSRCIDKVRKILDPLEKQIQKNQLNQQNELFRSFQQCTKRLNAKQQSIERTIRQRFKKIEQQLQNRMNNYIERRNQSHDKIEIINYKLQRIKEMLKALEEKGLFINAVRNIFRLQHESIRNDIHKQIESLKPLSDAFQLRIEAGIEIEIQNLLAKFIVFDNTIPEFKPDRSDKKVSDVLAKSRLSKQRLSPQKKQNVFNTIVKQSYKQKVIYGLNSYRQDSKKKYLHFFQNDENFLNLFDIDHPNTSFTRIKLDIGFKIPIFHKSISVPNGDLYLIGGSIPNSTVKSQKIYKYDFEKRTLIYCTSMKYGRSSHSICFNNKFIYIAGGYLNNQELTNKCERFEIGTNKIYEIQNCKYASNSFAMCSFNGRYVFKFGGLNQKQTNINIIERYDEKTSEWTHINMMSAGLEFKLLSTSAAIQLNSNEIIVMGGYDNNHQGDSQTFIFCVEAQNYFIRQLNVYPLPFSEGFWNNIPIINNSKLFVLQNMPTIDGKDCLEDNRRILVFDGKQWKSLN